MAVLLLPTLGRAQFDGESDLRQSEPEELKVLGDDSHELLYEELLDWVRTRESQRWRFSLEKFLKSRKALEGYQSGRRESYLEILGEMPEQTPLNPRVTGTIEADGYRIEKVLFESRPHHHVTANLYVPTSRPGPFPGVLVACGHSNNGKAADTYQRVSILLALEGFVALIYDPIGQGERHQLDIDRHGTTEHELLNHGALLVGESVVKHELWDGVRALDYLLSRPEVDPDAPVGMTGNSGGGTQTTFLMGYDERIFAAAPSCFVMTRRRLFQTIGPQDGCQHLPGEGYLHLDHADYAIMRAPKPTLILAAEKDFFEFAATEKAYAEARAAYEVLGAPERMGLFSHDDEHGFSKPRREAAAAWMKRWLLDNDSPVVEPELTVQTDQALQVTRTGQVRTDFPDEVTVFDLSLARARELETERPSFGGEGLTRELRKEVEEILGFWRTSHVVTGPVQPRFPPAFLPRERYLIDRDGFRIEKRFLRTGCDPDLPFLLYVPRIEWDPSEHPSVIYVHGEGKAVDAGPGGRIEKLVGTGHVVAAVDLRGIGETRDHGSQAKFRNSEHRVAAISLHLGQSLFGQRVEDLDNLLGYLRREELINEPVEIIGIGSAAPIVLHAAVLADPPVRVRLRGGIKSWTDDVVARPTDPNLMGYAVPNVLEHYDLPDLVRLLGDRVVIEDE